MEITTPCTGGRSWRRWSRRDGGICPQSLLSVRRVSSRQTRYFLLHQRKYPKSVSRGRSPWTPPAQKRCQHSFPASETRRYADSFDGLRPCSQQLSAVVRTQVTAWPGDGQGFVSRLAGRRNRFRALPVQAPQGGVLSNHPGGTRAEPAWGTFQVSMLPPEGERGTPTDAP